jgi:hypothetical protein
MYVYIHIHTHILCVCVCVCVCVFIRDMRVCVMHTTGKADASSAPEKAAWAAQRSAAMKRARGNVAEEDSNVNLPLTDRITRMLSIKFIVMKSVETGISISEVSALVQLLTHILRSQYPSTFTEARYQKSVP